MASSSRRRQGAVLLLALGLLGGCAQVSYDRVPLDSPMPFEAKDLAACQGILTEGASCVALVRADQWSSDTGLDVAKGEYYRITVPPGQFWFDADRLNLPPKGEKGSWLMNRVAHLKRQSNSDWFSLIAVVREASGVATCKAFDLGSESFRHGQIAIEDAGKLALYPNDAESTIAVRDYFYRNNHGQVWTVITRCDRTCPIALPPTDNSKGSDCREVKR